MRPYAVAGAGLVHKVFKLKTVVQAGTMHIVLDRHDDYLDTMTFLGSNWRNGEVHVWFAIPHEGGLVEFVDLSSRHYRRYVEGMPKVDGKRLRVALRRAARIPLVLQRPAQRLGRIAGVARAHSPYLGSPGKRP